MTNIAVFVCDPGGHTGLAWAILDPTPPIEDSLMLRMNAGSITITGDERTQIREVTSLWQSFFRACVRAFLPPERVWFVMENFIYAPGVNYEGESAKISTAIIWGVEGYRMGQADEWAKQNNEIPHVPTMILQSASEASQACSNAQLKEYGLWVTGSDHERSAHKHMVRFLKKYRTQFPAG